MKNFINKSYILLVLALAVFVSSCEDTPPVDYVQQKYLEAFLIVDEPIEGIMLLNSQPVNTKFDKSNAMIKDADVKLVFNGTTHTLIYRDGDKPGYYHPNPEIKVLPETKYEIIINTPDGKLVSSETTTPKRIGGWVREPLDFVHYPQDTLKLPRVDSLEIEWEKQQGVNFYLLCVTAKDSVNYGRYLNPPTEEMNRRAYNALSSMEGMEAWYRNLSNWNLIANTSTPTVWMAFKWFGPHDVSVYSPDPNMLNWFVNLFFTGTSENNKLMNSVQGGIGVFGSCSRINKEIFLYKNQP